MFSAYNLALTLCETKFEDAKLPGNPTKLFSPSLPSGGARRHYQL